MPYHGHVPEVLFEVDQEGDGCYCAECLTENIFTEGDTWEHEGASGRLSHHIILETEEPAHQRIAIPDHHPLRLGTFVPILRAGARHQGVTRNAIIGSLQASTATSWLVG